MIQRNYKREAILLCARDLEAHYDMADGFHLDDTEPSCTRRQARAFRRAIYNVIRSLYLRAGIDWDVDRRDVKTDWKAQAMVRAAAMEAAMTTPDQDLPSPPGTFDNEEDEWCATDYLGHEFVRGVTYNLALWLAIAWPGKPIEVQNHATGRQCTRVCIRHDGAIDLVKLDGITNPTQLADIQALEDALAEGGFSSEKLRALLAQLKNRPDPSIEVMKYCSHGAAPGVFDANKARTEMLAEIDTVLQGTPHWQGGRLDTIKHLLALVEKAEAAMLGGKERATALDIALRRCCSIMEDLSGLISVACPDASEWTDGLGAEVDEALAEAGKLLPVENK